jgi:nucleoside-diphosphate-sugar epimerase
MTAIEHPLGRDLQHILTRTEALWEEMRRQRVFITGGTGFVGRWMLESFLWANDMLTLGARVVVLSRRPDILAGVAPHLTGHPAVTVLQGDVGTFDYPDGEYSHVLHLAKEPDPRMNASPGLDSVVASVAGTERVLAFAASHGTSKLLFTSSGAVYGRQPEDCERLREDYAGAPSPEDPHASYAFGKRAAESLCCATAEGSRVQVKIARGFTFVGPYMNFDAGYAVGNFIRDAICRDALEVTGDGTPLRSYMYAADLAVWLWTILFAGDKAAPYNVGSPDAVSISDLAQLVARSVGGGKPVHVAESPPPGLVHPATYVPDTSRAESGLGLRVEIGLEEALRRTARWYRTTHCGG